MRTPASTCLALLGASLCLLVSASPAFAGGGWRLSSRPAPTLLPPGGKARITVAAVNVGDARVSAARTPVTISDTLPAGLEATEIRGYPAFHREASHLMSCSLQTLSCVSKPETLPPFERLEVEIAVNVKPAASPGEADEMSVHGGQEEDGGPEPVEVESASLSQPLTFSGQATPFGVEPGGYAIAPEEEGGTSDTQAGSHPFQLTTTLDLNQALEPAKQIQSAPALPKQLSFNLPPGLIGDPRAVAQCSGADFDAYSLLGVNACKPDTAIGVAEVTIDEPLQFGVITRAVPLFNLEPARGEPARFGFEIYDNPIVLDTAVRSGGDYGVTVTVNNAPEAAQLLGSEVTIWGVPGDPRHDQSRGWGCIAGGIWTNHEQPCQAQNQTEPPAFLTLPTSCTEPIKSTVEGRSWPLKSLASEAGQLFSLEGRSTEFTFPTGMSGCQQLAFDPAFHVQSEAHSASTPTGLKVDVHLPQQGTEQSHGLAEPDLRAATVTLPAGVQLNPASADGLQACSEQQIGYEGPAGADPLSEGAPQPLRFSTEPAHCPEASKVAAVRVHTPLLEHELLGAVYLAEPAPSGEAGRNPFDSLLALYIVAEEPDAGVRVKLSGEVTLNAQTGQVSSTFTSTPQLPFEDFELEFFGGPRASLTTPPLCGDYASQAAFTPWSQAVGANVLSAPAEFAVTSGAGASACSNPQPFAPSLQAGSINLQAGAFTPFSFTITHPDADQALDSITAHLPPGMAAMLASVTLCPEPQAARGECSGASEIGQATSSAGLGSDPFTLSGRVYLTGPYDGAPFGLTIVTPADAGPFHLGDVIVRSAISVDPETAAVTISSSLPTMVSTATRPTTGIPVALKQVNVLINRPSFEFNPTNCSPMRIEAALAGSEGASAVVSSPFEVAGCQSLPFDPALSAATSGHASKADGANFIVKVTSKGLGQANIAKVDLQLPKMLPARLSTLQKACTEAAFNANPASCPQGSDIGTATIHTPVLRNPLTGPAYLVSHGNAAFPDVEFVLQGEGITLVLDGKTQIKKGITYSKFESAPDAPFTTFETVLPAGPHSALTASVAERKHFELCGETLEMPTTIVGQNGAVIDHDTRITIQGCSAVKAVKARRLTDAQKLAKALKACRHKYKHSRRRRQRCETQARHTYAGKAAARGRKTRSSGRRRG